MFVFSGQVGDAGTGLVMGTPPSVSTAQRSPATSATPSTPVVSLHAGDGSADTTLATVGCVYFAETFLLNGTYHHCQFLLLFTGFEPASVLESYSGICLVP